MVKIKVTITLLPDDDPNAAGVSYELDADAVARILPILIGSLRPPVVTEEAPPGMFIAEWASWAYAQIGKQIVTTRELANYMLASGWRTKSARPPSVVALCLDASHDKTELRRSGRGRWVVPSPAPPPAASTPG